MRTVSPGDVARSALIAIGVFAFALWRKLSRAGNGCAGVPAPGTA